MEWKDTILMDEEEEAYAPDSKFKQFTTAVDKALKSFEYSTEWADLISCLGKLNKVSKWHNFILLLVIYLLSFSQRLKIEGLQILYCLYISKKRWDNFWMKEDIKVQYTAALP